MGCSGMKWGGAGHGFLRPGTWSPALALVKREGD